MSAPSTLATVVRSVLATLFCLLCTVPLDAAEETEFSWPLGPIGGKFRIWTGEPYIRVTEVTAGAPGASAGLQVGDFLTGAFGQAFDPITASKFDGPVRQLGAAIDYAELNSIPLPLAVIRPGTGTLTVTVTLPASSGLSPLYTRGNPRFDALYETACANVHSRILTQGATYPLLWGGIGLLGHPNWNDTTGPKPYRLSINAMRDAAVNKINSAILTPVEHLYMDRTTNPSYVDPGLENWSLGQAVMFLSEYVVKTGEQATYQTILQRAAVLMANRIENWAQPDNNTAISSNLSYTNCRGATGHGGVVGDYTHQWYVSVNMCGVHLFTGLAMAKRAGADMTVRPKDGHYFGLTLNPGDAIPANIADALPATIILPRGAQDSRVLPHLDNVTNAPLTTITTADSSNNPWYYDCSLDQKFWIQWDYLRRSTTAQGAVGYTADSPGGGDSGGRTPAAFVGMKIYQNGGAVPAAEDQALVNLMATYMVANHDIHLNAHAYNMGGTCFTAMSMPYLPDRDQQYILDNWKFFYNLSGRPDGTIAYFRGREFGDGGDPTDTMSANIVLAGSVARGGLPHLPAFNANRVVARVRQPFTDWPTKEARRLRLPAGVNSTTLDLDLFDGNGAVIDPANVTASWSVLSGPATTGVIATPTALDTVATFPQPGTYRLQLVASSGAFSTTELIDVHVLTAPIAGYVMGEADYKVYTGITGGTVANLTGDPKFPTSPDSASHPTQLEGTYSGENYGASLTCVVIPPATGNYRFYIASDDASELRFNTAGPAASTTVIASTSQWTDRYQWNKYGTQQSAVVSLTAGQPYYLQALHKEGGGGDHLAVAWTTPTNSTITVIGSASIARPATNDTPAITSQPADVTTTVGSPVSFTLGVTGPVPRIFQWRRNGVNFGTPVTTSTFTFPNASARLSGTWDCVYTSGSTVLTSNTATLAFSDAGALTDGALWKEYFLGATGGTIAGLTSLPSYPLASDSSGPLQTLYTGEQGDTYGQRWTGWLKPGVSGNYRFYTASDDAIALYVSTDEFANHKQLLQSASGATVDRAWSTRGATAWIPMVAGQRYYIEVLHSEGGGGDHCAVAWQREGDASPVNGSGEIPAAYLQYMTGGYPGDPASTPPLANADTISVLAGNSTTLTPLANDIDSPDAALTITSVTQPTIGNLSITPGGQSLSFTSSATVAGTTAATYTVTNSRGQSATATLTITIRDLTAGLLAHWRMDETGGVKLQDAVSGNHATLTGGTRTSGVSGNAVTFNGTSTDKATAPAASCAGLTDQVTIAFWSLGGSSNAQTSVLYAKDASNNRVLNIHLPYGTTVYWDAGNSGTSSYDRISKGASAAELTGTWAHWAFTKNATTGDMKIFRNGVLWHSGTGLARTFPAITSVNLGWDGGTTYLNGSLDDFRIYNTALSAADVALLASAPPQPFVLLGNSFAIAENAATGAAVGAISATPAAPATAVSYAITAGNSAGRFAINPATGTLTVAAPLDFETTPGHSLTITATDNASPARANTALATVNLTNINEPPAFASPPLTRPNGAVALAYSATLAGSAADPDAGDTLTYSKTGGPLWLAVAANGALTGTPDTAGTQVFTVRVTDAAGLYAETTLTITVADSTLYTGLGGWWRMNEGAGATTADSSGSGRSATLTASPTWTTGKLGGGLAFNGTSQYLTITGSTTPSPLTISAWIKPTGTTGIQTIFSQASAFSFRTNGTGLRFTTLGVKDYDIGSLVTAGTWQHVAVTFTPNTTGGCKLYLNGALRYTSANTTAQSINSNTNAWQIGRTGTAEYFGGSLDDVRLYTRVLTDLEIAGICNSATPFEDWRASNFPVAQLGNSAIAGPTADPDGDGIRSLMEYALGLNPTTPGDTRLKLIADTVTDTGANYLRLTVNRDPSATDLTYAVETSADLNTWSAAETVVLSNAAGQLVVRDSIPDSTAAPRRFIRLKVRKNP